MKFTDLKKKSIKELNDLLKAKREEFRSLRFSIGSEQEKNVRKLREVKKVIARVLTILNNGVDTRIEKNVEDIISENSVGKEEKLNIIIYE